MKQGDKASGDLRLLGFITTVLSIHRTIHNVNTIVDLSSAPTLHVAYHELIISAQTLNHGLPCRGIHPYCWTSLRVRHSQRIWDPYHGRHNTLFQPLAKISRRPFFAYLPPLTKGNHTSFWLLGPDIRAMKPKTTSRHFWSALKIK